MLNQDPNEEIEVRSPSRVPSMIGIFLVLISIVGYVFYTKNLSSDVDVIKANISTKTSSIEALTAKIDEFKSAEEEYDVSTEVKRLESLKAIPAEMNQDEVIRDLINITDLYDVSLKSLSFGQGSSNYEGVNSLKINASFEGNYSDLVSFLEGLEQNPRIFKVNSISVQVNELDVLELKRATFSLSMEAFFQKLN